MTISQRASDVRIRQRQGKIGQLVFSNYLDVIATLINANPQAKQVDTITVDTAADDTDYTFVLNGITITINSGTGATKITISDALRDAVNQNALVRGQVIATSDGVDEVTLTGALPGVAYTITESDANLTLTPVTTAASADAIPFGRLVLADGFVADEGYRQGKIAKSANLTAQVDTYTPTYVASAEYLLTIAVKGVVTRDIQVVGSVSLANTLTDIAAAINAVMPANSVLADGSSGTEMTLTAEVAGLEFETSFGFGDGGASIPTATLVTTRGVGTSMELAATKGGVSIYAQDEETTTIGGTAVEYPANAGVKVTRKAEIWVESSESPSDGDPVYVEMAAGDNSGKFYKTASATRVPMTLASWVRAARSSSGDNLAVLRVDLV